MHDLLKFLEAIDSVAAEIEARVPGYFARLPLRCLAPPAVCERIAKAWNLPVVAANDVGELGPVDRLLHDRVAALQIGREGVANDPLLVAFRDERRRLRNEAELRVASLTSRLERRSVTSIEGLDYFTIGSGPAVVAINAIGQGIAPWLRLVDRLADHYRVIIMPIRGTGAFADHCGDLRAVVQQERLAHVHLVGWCTGAKLAVGYARAFGGVASMVFLAGAFKHPDRAPELDTPYERNLESTLRALVRDPAIAERIRLLFQRTAVEAAALDPEALALYALSAAPSALEADVRRPFGDAATLVAYARQHVEFWSHDETAAAADVAAPILGIAGQHDTVVLPAGVRDAVARFPVAEWRELPGTTHYALYERAETVAEWIGEWIDCTKLRSHAAAGVLESSGDH